MSAITRKHAPGHHKAHPKGKHAAGAKLASSTAEPPPRPHEAKADQATTSRKKDKTRDHHGC